MRQPDLTKWRYTPQLEGVLFFAQAIEEFLFHHTFDGFRAPALNTHSRAYELYYIATQYDDGKVTSSAVEPIIEELKWSIKNDAVISGGSSGVITTICRRLNVSSNTPEELSSLSLALLKEISSVYWPALKEKIIEAVLKPRKKEELLKLAQTFTAEIELEGFDRQFLYRTNNEFFFDPNNDPTRIYDPRQIIGFLKLFDKETRSWSVVFRGTEVFSEFSGLSEEYGINITVIKPVVERELVWADEFLAVNTRFPLYITIPEIKAKEFFTARDTAEYLLEAFISVCSFYDHHANFEWSNKSLIINEETQYLELLERRINPMFCGDVRADASTKTSILNAINIFGGKTFAESAKRGIKRAFEYHAAALKTLTNENKLLDLWVTLEGFIPVTKKKQDRITYYTNMLVPVLTLSYTLRLFSYMADNLRYGGSLVRNFIEDSSSTGDFLEKATKIIVCEDMKDMRSRLYGLLNEHPLLKYRVFRCHDYFYSSKRIENSIREYRALVIWHIRRIYNMRNQIVHSARSLPYLSTLVENLHSYVDSLIDAVTKLDGTPRDKLDIFDALIKFSILSDCYLAKLSGEDVKCISGNYWDLLFGAENPLIESS
ncbi:MAG: hypothetical protein PVH29_02560 [Candidatus Zixiibacteriota bacterium]|jgi:hypothetical protein